MLNQFCYNVVFLVLSNAVYIILILTGFISMDRLTDTGFTKCIYVNMNFYIYIYIYIYIYSESPLLTVIRPMLNMLPDTTETCSVERKTSSECLPSSIK